MKIKVLKWKKNLLPLYKWFLDNNKNSTGKKLLLVAEYTNFELELLEKYQGELAEQISSFIVL